MVTFMYLFSLYCVVGKAALERVSAFLSPLQSRHESLSTNLRAPYLSVSTVYLLIADECNT